MAGLVHNAVMQGLFTFQYAAELSSHFFTQSIEEKYTQVPKFLKINNFTAFH